MIDVDLTKGDAGPGTVTGGVWAGGWRMTAAKDRIVYDAGVFVTSGSFKASFTIKTNPSQLSGNLVVRIAPGGVGLDDESEAG